MTPARANRLPSHMHPMDSPRLPNQRVKVRRIISSWVTCQRMGALGVAPGKTVIWQRYVRNVPFPPDHSRRELPRALPSGVWSVFGVERAYEPRYSLPGSGNSRLIRTQLNATLGPAVVAEVNFLSRLGQDPVGIVSLCLIKFSAQCSKALILGSEAKTSLAPRGLKWKFDKGHILL